MAIGTITATQSGDRSASFSFTAGAGDTLTLNALGATLSGTSTIKTLLNTTTANQTIAWLAANGLVLTAVGTSAGTTAAVALTAAGTLTFTDAQAGGVALRFSVPHSVSA